MAHKHILLSLVLKNCLSAIQDTRIVLVIAAMGSGDLSVSKDSLATGHVTDHCDVITRPITVKYSEECKELTCMLDLLSYRWGVPPVIRCVHWTMQRGVLQTWITPQSPAIVMNPHRQWWYSSLLMLNSNIRHTKPENLNISYLCSIHWSQVLSREWRCSWSSAESILHILGLFLLVWDSWTSS